MAGNRTHRQLIFQNENLDIHQKGASVDVRTTGIKKPPKKGGGLGNRKALNDITNWSSLHYEVSSKKKNHQKEDFTISEERFLHDHNKCIDAQRKATECNFLDLVLPGHDLVSSVTSPKSKQEKVGLDSPLRNLETVQELSMSEISAWLNSPIRCDSPTLWDSPPSSPFSWKFEPVEFVLNPEIDG